MKPNERFTDMPDAFVALIRVVTEDIGYSTKGCVVEPTEDDITQSLRRNNLAVNDEMVSSLVEYTALRASEIQAKILPNMMGVTEASFHVEELRDRYNPKCNLPHNNQGEREPRYLTCIVNILLENNLPGCDYNPQQFVRFVSNGMILGALSRRVDGAFPSCVNPIAFWELKEFYRNKSFGSRCAAALMDSLLDGEEMKNLRQQGVRAKHYLFLDAFPKQGISYICRLYDALHAGLIDEIICGREALRRVPELANQWKGTLR